MIVLRRKVNSDLGMKEVMNYQNDATPAHVIAFANTVRR